MCICEDQTIKDIRKIILTLNNVNNNNIIIYNEALKIGRKCYVWPLMVYFCSDILCIF